MAYYTYFNGELEISLKEPYLNILSQCISEIFTRKDTMTLNENSLEVDGEWSDHGLMQDIVLFIAKYGQLNSGIILCEGEDMKDIWEFIVYDKKPFMLELDEYTTLSRIENKELFIQQSIKEKRLSL